ncbi:unnamed protein product, partial [Chrysoparadoxa australica]
QGDDKAEGGDPALPSSELIVTAAGGTKRLVLRPVDLVVVLLTCDLEPGAARVPPLRFHLLRTGRLEAATAPATSDLIHQRQQQGAAATNQQLPPPKSRSHETPYAMINRERLAAVRMPLAEVT